MYASSLLSHSVKECHKIMKKPLFAILTIFLLLAGQPGNLRAAQAEPETISSPEECFLANVTLEGGSGRSSVESPARIWFEEDACYAAVHWSSSNYDFMLVDGVTYYPVSTQDGSLFEIPIPAPPCSVKVQADTIAMSTPHLIDYTLNFESLEERTGEQMSEARSDAPDEQLSSDTDLPGLQKTGTMTLSFAEGFRVEYYESDMILLTVLADSSRFLLLPEDAPIPQALPEDIRVLHRPVANIYLAATADMDFFVSCDALSCIRFASRKEEDWTSPAVREAISEGAIEYAGKYSAPDFERIYAGACSLAIENTMIYHSPQIKEQLEALDIPVLVDHASYETTPQGRMEWVRLYGVLTGHEKEADKAFEEQLKKFRDLEGLAQTGRTAAYFYINSAGAAVIRRSSDYIPALIRLAGGEYALEELAARGSSGSHSGTMAVQTEEFYAAVRDADYLIYSSDITGELQTRAQLLDKCPLLAKCRAFESGQVYCTSENLYESVMSMGDFVTDLHLMFTQEDPDMTFLRKLE